ncbi:MAG: hypothetical protein RL585_455 [Pseudomonadota bacterium]|jgi:hypothetical protein
MTFRIKSVFINDRSNDPTIPSTDRWVFGFAATV